MKKRILEDEFVFSISISSNQSIAMIGVLNKNQTEDKNASLSIYLTDLGNNRFLSYRSFMSIDQLKTCHISQSEESPVRYIPDIKATPDLEFVYWACNQDYGYVDIAEERVSRFLAQKTIETMALAKDNKVLLKMDSDETNLHALYHNFQRNDPFIWKPVSISRLKLDPSAKVVTTKSDRIVYIINSNSTLQIYNTSENNFSLISTIELEKKPLSFIPSKDGKRFYMKTDEKTIQIYDISTQKLVPIDFFTTISEFVVSPDDQIIFATQENDKNTTIIFADIKNLSSPATDYLLVRGKRLIIKGSAKLLKSPGRDSLAIFNQTGFIFIDAATTKKGEIRYKPYISDKTFESATALFGGEWIYIVENNKNNKQKTLTLLNPGYFQPSVPIPYLTRNLPVEISNEADFGYLSTPEYLIEIQSKYYSLPTSRIMKLSLKQFSLTGDDRFMYAVIGDDLEILDLRSKYALASLKEDFRLGASEKANLQLLERSGQSKWNPVYKKHKFLTANFSKASIMSDEDEPVISYFALPNWINFDKDTAEITIESRLPSHLGTYKIYTTGSFQLPSSLSFLNDSDHLIADLIDRGYLDEERFLTTKFNAYKKLTLSPQYSQFESDIRYFLRNYATDQEFAFKVSSSLFLRQYPPLLEIETQSSHYTTARIVLPTPWADSGIVTRFVQRTYSSCRSILNKNQTELTFDGTLPNINEALAEIIIDIKYPDQRASALLSISDSLNPLIETQIYDASKFFRINAQPIANPDPNLSVQSQINKSPLVSGQFFNPFP